MRRYSFFNFIKQGALGFLRNGFMSSASILTLASALLIMGCFAALILNIDLNISSIDDYNEIVCYVALDADNEKVKSIGEEIKALSNVAGIVFVSKEEALESERQRYGEEYSQLFDDYSTDGTNPLPDSYRVTYSDQETVDSLVYQLGKIDGIDKVKDRFDIAIGIAKVKNVISIVSTWLMVMLLIVSVAFISNTIKIAFKARENEISIMKYIGATNYYITMPFIIEGFLIGLISGVAAFILQSYIYTYIVEEIAANYSIISTVPYSEFVVPYAVIFIAGGSLVGVLGSAFSARKYMKV